MKKYLKKALFLLLIISFFYIGNVKALGKDIKITDIIVKDKSSTITVADPVIDLDEISSSISFNKKDDFVLFELTIKNNEIDKYKISSITDNNENDNISIDYTYDKNFMSKGDTKKIGIKLSYKNELLNTDKISLDNLSIKINLENEEGTSDEIIINPNTGDNILHFLLLLIIALTGLIFVFKNKRIKGIKIGNLLVLFAILLIPFGVFAKEKYELNIKFSNIDIIGRFETYNITINPKDGSDVIIKDITYGEPIGELPSASKDGYNFIKWVDNDGNEITEDSIIEKEITIEAYYEIINYNITYNLNGGSLPSGKTNKDSYNIETDTFTLNNPTKVGYTFTGWTGTDLDNKTVSVTVEKGSTGIRNYIANYSANEDTPYTVVHRYQNLEDLSTYEEVSVTEYGETDKEVTAPRQGRTGFTLPSEKTVLVTGDGEASTTYTYDREVYDFSITDRTYIDNTSTLDGEYPYGTSITVKALARDGYTFEWSDGENELERTFTLEEKKELTPIYTANTNTPYKVKHYKQKITLDGYDIEDTENNTGTTDSPITPATNTYTGFTSPQTISTTIKGDGSTEVIYEYDREMYNFSVSDREFLDNTSTLDGSYPYEYQITLKAINRPGYDFKWSDNVTSLERTITLTSNNTSLSLIYTPRTDTAYTVYHKTQNLNDLTKYTLVYTDDLEGTTGNDATPAVRSYAGFTAPSTETKKINGDGSTTFEYLYTRNQYALTIVHPEYVVEDKSGDYYYEDTVTIEAIDREGYTFAGWSTGENTKSITVTIGTNDISEEPLYTANTDTVYKVIHKYARLTSGYDEEVINGTGTTGDTIPAPRQERAGFVLPDVQNITITGDGKASVTYIYNRDTYTFNIEDRTDLVNESTANGTYPYETVITISALEKAGYSFKWSDNVTDYSRSFPLTSNTTLSLIYEANTYTLTANANGGAIAETSGWEGIGSSATKTITYDQNYGTLPTANREGFVLAGWNTLPNGTGTNIDANTKVTVLDNIQIYAEWVSNQYTVSFDTDEGTGVSDIIVTAGESIITLPTTSKDDYYFEGWFESVSDENPVSEPYTPSGDITLHAKWSKIICKKATSLHEVTCNVTSSGSGCRKVYNQGIDYTYGNVIDSDTFDSGDAFDCDVDGTGYNQRFYYLRTIGDRAALVSYTNYEGNDGQGITNSYIYNEAVTKLPTTSQWDNLPISFENDTKSARLMQKEDIMAACANIQTDSIGTDDFLSAITTNSLLTCQFIFENTRYESGSTGRSGTWIEYPGDKYIRIHDSKVIVEKPDKNENSENVVRPVIEVPLNLIEDAYIIRFNANGGTVSNEFKYVKKGTKMNTLPTAEREGLVFSSWYTNLSFTEEVTENTIPNGYYTYYAKWVKKVEDATLDADSYHLEIGDTDSIVILDTVEIEPMTFESSDEDVVTVDSNGNLEAIAEGTATVTITGTKSHTTKVVDIYVVPELDDFTVTFDSQGGPSVNEMDVPKNTAIGTLPEPTWSGYVFGGWFTNTNFSVRVTEETIVRGNVIYYAKWIPENAVAEINHSFFTTLQSAFDSEMSGKTTIILLKDINPLSSTIDLVTKNNDKDIVFDLNGHSITSSYQVIKSKATLEIKNGSINCSAGSGAIDVKGGKLLMNSGSITATGSRQCIYNDGGTVEIGGNASFSATPAVDSTNKRGTIQSLKGTLTITGGTIISNNFGLVVTGGTFVLGEADGNYDTSSILIKGDQYGIYSDVDYSVYDGMIEGITAAVNDESKITNIETGTIKENDTDGNYNRLYYSLASQKYKISLEPNSGVVDPEHVFIDQGSEVGTLPTPSRGLYTFDGWYTNLINGVKVESTDIPTGNVTYYAKWSFESSDNIVNFNMNNNAIETYSNNIDEWKELSQASFQANMSNNFTSNSCSSCNADNSCETPLSGTQCDKSIGFETGVDSNLIVYESDENDQEVKNLITYTTSNNGTIYNMIPGQTYYWESSDDSSIYGYVKVSGFRRMINTSVRNVRDLGGLEVDANGDGVADGTILYNKLYRGAELSTNQSDVTNLKKLGITREIDLRPYSQGKNKGQAYFPDKYDISEPTQQDVIITNYLIDPNEYIDNYHALRDAMKVIMRYIINDDDSIYFHCTIGTDRTGTIAYFLEGLLGVSEEDRVEDYELSYYFGMTNRDRYHDSLSNSQINPRFTSMHNKYDTNAKIYDWFVNDPSLSEEDRAADQAEAISLVNAFRTKMINSY